MPKPSDPRMKSGFVGLRNQGATCYLNSLIQAMYMTPELRFGLYSVNPTELGADIVRSSPAFISDSILTLEIASVDE